MPVPAGMSLPMMTFSFSPSSESLREWIAASVRTRGVSWKDAAGRRWEGGGGQPRLGRERGRGEAHGDGASRSRGAALGDHPTVLLLELRTLGQLTGQQLRLSGLEDVHPLQHLADDDLDVLVVDGHTLRPVDLLDLLDEVQLHRAGTEDPQHLVRVDRTGVQLLADLDVL